MCRRKSANQSITMNPTIRMITKTAMNGRYARIAVTSAVRNVRLSAFAAATIAIR